MTNWVLERTQMVIFQRYYDHVLKITLKILAEHIRLMKENAILQHTVGQ